MSWSVTFIGKPDNIVKALEENSSKLSGQSKEEYDAALPHLIGLIKQNYNSKVDPALKLVASGHGANYGDAEGAQKYQQCTVSMEYAGPIV